MTLYDTSAGDLSLAFVNTLNWRGRDDPEEMFLTYADWITWSREAGLIDASQAAAHLMVSEERSRIHACGNSECRAMFVDRSRNQSRKWCSSESCGNRIRVRQFYSRTRKPEDLSHSDHF